MELGFEKMQLPYLRQLLSQTKEMELTQEVKLPEQLPDVRDILAAWGQVLIRSKEWRSQQDLHSHFWQPLPFPSPFPSAFSGRGCETP